MQIEDKALIAQIRKGSQLAFRKLLERHQQFAFNLAFRILCNEEDAKDTVQDSFIKIWKSINSFKENVKFTTWMYKIVTNTAIDKLRVSKNKLRINLNDLSDQFELINQTSVEEKLENREIGKLIHILASGLPEKQRLVFVLRDIHGIGSTEVQHILDMNETSVKSNLYHARKLIREKLSKIISYEKDTK